MTAAETKEPATGPELIPDYSPKGAFVAEVAAAGRRLAEFSIEFSSDKPGELKEVADILEKHKVNILSGFHEFAHWSFFADLTRSDVSAVQLGQELKTLPDVKKVQSQDGLNGVIVDTLHHPLMMEKNRAVLFRLDTIGSVFSRPREIFGAEGPLGKVLLHQMGRAGGQSSLKAFSETMGRDRIREQLPNIMNMYAAGGWGIFKLMEVDFDRGVAVVQAFENFECTTHRGKGGEPYSQYVRGDLAGLFSEVFDKKVDAVETQCVVQGASFCRFEIAPASKGTA
ncbi:MAG: V4R domain-containing protein [Candidatus Bathyarchaeia archaeon]|jgi:predicted hydrocarbon binding protein